MFALRQELISVSPITIEVHSSISWLRRPTVLASLDTHGVNLQVDAHRSPSARPVRMSKRP